MVEARLVAAFRRLPNCPVFALPEKGVVPRRLTGLDDGAGAADVLAWAELLDDDREGRLVLWAWARCRAGRESFGAVCREAGWSRTTAEVGRRRGADAIARRLTLTLASTG